MAHKSYGLKTSGPGTRGPVDIPRNEVEGKKVPPEKLQPYFPDEDLVKAVNVALLLNRPLLIMGEPGCGKSLLAKDIAFQWYGKEMHTRQKYFEWNVKSTSKAKEGIYEFDQLRRFRDANKNAKANENLEDYVRFGPLAEAMKSSTETDKAVLLIDEIDKADIDFSNDLLNELEQNAFTVTETQKTEIFPHKPFIVITSNSEKDLSEAFLRRCVFHFIDVFSNDKINTAHTKDWLTRIVAARYYKNEPIQNEMIEKAIQAFIELRRKMNADPLTFRKTVSTSEFLDWFSVLKQCSERPEVAKEMRLEEDFKAWMTGVDGHIPFANTLFKTKSLFDLQHSKVVNG